MEFEINNEDDLANYVVEDSKTNYDIIKSIQGNLNEEEIKIYGVFNRQPIGFKKIDLLGKGGCAIVWLCENL